MALFYLQEILVIKTILRKAETKNSRSMRYDPEFLLECVMLRIKSKSTYNHLRTNNILPLPSAETIRRLLSCMPCKFGLNSFALSSIKTFLSGKPKAMCYGSLVWDEMAISGDVTFDSMKLVFEGFVDYGEDEGFGEPINFKKHEGELADHALVLIFRPYRYSWIQPIACYATKGACPGSVIHQLMGRAIAVLHQQGAIVKSVVCDGAQTNKTVMRLCGITGKHNCIANTFNGSENVPNTSTTSPLPVNDDSSQDVTSFEHPTLDEALIYFLVDVPHLLKTIRNNIFTVKDVQVYSCVLLYCPQNVLLIKAINYCVV